MFYKRKDFPEVGEILLCTVKKILPNSVFVSLDEFDNKEGMIHISEISPGRIRNLRDFVVEGKKIVCKVLNVRKDKGYIDLSLRRVPLSVRKNKLEEIKQEEKAEKILEITANNLKTDLKDLYEKFGYKVLEEYGLINTLLQKIAGGDEEVIKEFNIQDKYAKELVRIVKEKIKPPEVKISSELVLKNYSPDGIEKIKQTLNEIKEIAKKENYRIKIIYLGAPRYMLTIESTSYKVAEKNMGNIFEKTKKIMQKLGCEGEIIKR